MARIRLVSAFESAHVRRDARGWNGTGWDGWRDMNIHDCMMDRVGY